MSIRQKQDEIVSEFALFDDWMQKYEYMIELVFDEYSFKINIHIKATF